MMRPIFVLLALLLACWVESGEAQTGEAQIGHTMPTSDHIISDGPVGPLDSQIRYLMGDWPRDFRFQW